MTTAAPTLPLKTETDRVNEVGADDLQMWAVTTIIDALDKPALMYWSAEQSALAAVHEANTWRGMLADCPEDCEHSSANECAAVKWLRDAHKRRPRQKRSATKLGQLVHAACEKYALDGRRPSDIDDEVLPFVQRFEEWCDRFQPSYEAVETVVYSPTYGYAGTCDAFLSIDGTRFACDYKTTRQPRDSNGREKTPYPEVSLQLAAYRYADFAATWRPRRTERRRQRYYLLSPSEREWAVEVPKVEGGLCIQLTPESCEAYPVRCDTAAHRSFLYVQEAARWSYDQSRDAVKTEPLMARGT